jgi:diguanylate cyclase (GGDEF)-like protein
LGEGISGWVAQNGKPILNGNAAVEPSYHIAAEQHDTLRAAISMPVFDSEREVFAVLTLYALKADFFSKHQLRILQAMESKLSLCLQSLRPFNNSQNEAETDSLTNLPNAEGLFVELDMELGRCRRTANPLAIVICDIASMKDVNDHEGQLAGSKLLCRIAELFRERCRSCDTVARIGGAQFVFLWPNTGEGDLSERLSSISDLVTSARDHAGVKTAISASFGASFFPADGDTAEDLLALAERRMYAKKHPRHDHGTLIESSPLVRTV